MEKSSRTPTFALTAVTIGIFLAFPASAETDFCQDEEWMSFENWDTWEQITEQPVVSGAHGGNWVTIFANDLAHDLYVNIATQYPECATIAKALHDDEEGSAVRKLTVMVKMPAGYDPDHGDWWYGTVDPTGTVITDRGRIEGCIECHEVAEENDYVFSDNVMETIRDWEEWSE